MVWFSVSSCLWVLPVSSLHLTVVALSLVENISLSFSVSEGGNN